jgi:carbon-monoxide dehydrogenase large subunit
MSEPEVGRARLRKEDARLVTGRTLWTENIALPGMLHMAILRSPYAHARIASVDTSAARGRANVIAAYSGADLADTQGVLACAWPVTEDIVMPEYLPLAVREVRHVGEPVAVVVARDRNTALDALETIDVSYEPLPVVLDLEAALAEGSPLVHSDKGTNKCYTWIFDSAEAGTGGNVREAEAEAEVVIKRRYVQQRLIPSSMEPRSVVVDPTGGDTTVYSATQIPHIVRFLLAATTGTPEHKIRVVAPDVGGGFGGKLAVTPEEWIAFAVARKLGRPVKYTESRAENMVSAHHGRDLIQEITLTARRDGTVTGLDVNLIANMGAYLGIVTPGVPLLGAFMYNAIYKFPAYRFVCTGVFTNTTKTDAYRGAGRPEATYAIERVMDELAVELGLDPMEVRRRNWIKHEEFRSPRWPGSCTTPATTSRPPTRRWRCSGTTTCGPSSGPGARRTTRCSSAWASRPIPRCAGWRRPGCSARCGTGPAAGSRSRSASCPPARWRWSAGPRRTARAT